MRPFQTQTNGVVALALAAQPSGALPLPAGDIAGFGSAIAAMTTETSDLVVVSAPKAGAGRVFLYRKPFNSSTFDPAVELLRPSGVSQFGKSVAVPIL